MGIQMLLAVFLAAFFRWSKFSAAAGVWITNPFTAPFIYTASYGVGLKISGITNTYNLSEQISHSIIQTILLKSPEIFWTLAIGGVVLGLPLAVMGYYASYSAVSKYQERVLRKKRQREKLAEQK